MEKENKKQMIQVVTVAAVILLLVMLVALIANIVKVANLAIRENTLKKEIAYQQQLISDNEQGIAYRNTDWYTEQYAREQLHMQKDGETLFEAK